MECMSLPVGFGTIGVEFLKVVEETDEDEDEDGDDDEPDDVFEALLVVLVDVERARVVNGTVLTCANSPKWKIFFPEQQVVPRVVSQQ
jgi:hypothetical protein